MRIINYAALQCMTVAASCWQHCSCAGLQHSKTYNLPTFTTERCLSRRTPATANCEEDGLWKMEMAALGK
ncbi:hypothetical protein KY289_026550 [Solanum tuberosum]|nr:hypothetical protein KY289_026550 [Solanum tuberosum]